MSRRLAVSRKLAVFCFGLVLAVPSVASAQNLVDRPDSADAPKGSVFNLFSSFKGFGFGNDSPNSGGKDGCEPIINAAGNAVRRRGCP